MPYNLLLLPLLGGFLFFHLTHYFRFGAQRLDGYRLLLQTAVAGTVLAALARLIIVSLEGLFGRPLGNIWQHFSPFEYSADGVLALLLGPLLAISVNAFVGKSRAKDIEIGKHGNAFTKLLHRAQKDNLLISVTLDTRKWYVGWVAESPNLDPQELYFRLLPFISGYRDKDSLQAIQTVFYDAALRDKMVDRRDLLITLPLRDVKIANLFDENLFNDYFEEVLRAVGEEPKPTHRHHPA